jgi:hypothetical protein
MLDMPASAVNVTFSTKVNFVNHGGHGEHGGKPRIEEKHVGVKSKPGAEVTSDGQL